MTIPGSTQSNDSGRSQRLMILLSGSHVFDVDAMISGHLYFKELAQMLAREGISTLRFGLSRHHERHLFSRICTLENRLNLMTEVMEKMPGEYYETFNKVVFIGHSDGSRIALLAAELYDQFRWPVSAIIALASGLSDFTHHLLYQQRCQLRGAKMSQAEIRNVLQLLAHLYQICKHPVSDSEVARIAENVPVSNPLLNNMLSQAIEDFRLWSQQPWVRELLNGEYLGKLRLVRVPVLCLWGELDCQVDASNEYQRINRTLSHPDSQCILLKDHNHLLQNVTSPNIGEYRQINHAISSDAVAELVHWLKKQG